MVNHAVTNPPRNAELSMQRDTAELLYSNSIAGILISAIASSALVLGFDNPEYSYFQHVWLSLISIVLVIRLLDSLHWRKYISGTEYEGKRATYRFISGTLVTAILWCIYALTMYAHVEIIELACMIIVVSAMAGGSATVLAAHRLTAMVYVFTLLAPFSVGMLLSEQGYQNILGALGLSFSIVMMVASKKASDFTTQAIQFKHENVALVNYMEEQVAERTQKIYELSNIDPLTGLFNRSAFLNEARLQLEQADIKHEYLALLFIDLDGFKKVNDSVGHATGDRVLAQTALRLQEQAPDNHLLCRWGGDEFLLMLANMNEAEVLEKAQLMITRISKPYDIDNNRITIGATIGVAFYPQHARNEVELIQLADTAMYHQKKRMPSSVGVFSDIIGYKISREQKLKARLAGALENQELRLVYQPILNTKDRSIFAFEALLRWQLDGEAIAPDEFICIAEQYGQIRKIGAWVLRESCFAAKRWQLMSDQYNEIAVSVNVSIIQMQDENFKDIVKEVLAESGLAPHCLFLEITESIFATDMDKLLQQVLVLQAMGVKVSIDDFGTGYSSLSAMQDLAVNLVKIDRSFINKIETNGQPIVNAVMHIADGLHFKVVAEGVETQEQMTQLVSLGVDYLQGFHFAKPMEEQDIITYLKP
tara:strand:- start:19002 stop:20951 length:1950 start_codon:yes stop_codon:yes gene_type:complete